MNNNVKKQVDYALAKGNAVKNEVAASGYTELKAKANTVTSTAEELRMIANEPVEIKMVMSELQKKEDYIKSQLITGIITIHNMVMAVDIAENSWVGSAKPITNRILRNMTDDKFLVLCDFSIKQFEERKERLIEMGYTEAVKVEMKNNRDEIVAVQARRTECENKINEIRKKQMQYLERIERNIAQLDIMVKSYGHILPDLQKIYFSITRNENSRKGNASVVGCIFETDNNPVANALVEFYPVKENGGLEPVLMSAQATESDKPLVSRFTGSKGGFTLTLDPGKYIAKISKQGFEIKEVVVYVNNNETTRIKSDITKL